MRRLARGCITRHHVHHYQGFADHQWRLFTKESPRRLKPLLYVFRVLLTGIHLMRSGELDANLSQLNDSFRLSYLDPLIARKREGAENQTIDDRDVALLEAESRRLRELLTSEGERTSLPEASTARHELHELLLRLRGLTPAP